MEGKISKTRSEATVETKYRSGGRREKDIAIGSNKEVTSVWKRLKDSDQKLLPKWLFTVAQASSCAAAGKHRPWIRLSIFGGPS